MKIPPTRLDPLLLTELQTKDMTLRVFLIDWTIQNYIMRNEWNWVFKASIWRGMKLENFELDVSYLNFLSLNNIFMQEIEVKILDIDKQKTILVLESLWAKKIYDGIIEWFFFKNTEGKKIRLRKTNTGNNVNYKKRLPSNYAIANVEFETSIWSVKTMKNILQEIWFLEYGYSKKYRTSYCIDNIIFDIDTYEWIPDVLEIEGTSQKWMEQWLDYLGYRLGDTVIMTERELKEFYQDK